jgi:hypothetical protein
VLQTSSARKEVIGEGETELLSSTIHACALLNKRRELSNK